MEAPVIPQLTEAVIKSRDAPHIIPSTNWEPVRNILVQHLQEKSVALKQIISIPKHKNILVECCIKGYIDLIFVFIKNNFPVNDTILKIFLGSFGNLLHIAASGLQLPLVKYLVSCGADVNARCIQGTPLHCTIKCYFAVNKTPLIQADIIKFLLEAGCHIDGVGFRGESPLGCAVMQNNIDFAKLLIRYGACINGNRNDPMSVTPLCCAVNHGSVQSVKFLIEEGADVNFVDKLDDTALSCAVRQEKFEIIHLLLNSGAYLSIRYPDGDTILHIAVERACQNVIELLLERGAIVDLKNDNNITPLYKYVFETNAIRDNIEAGFPCEDDINIVGTLVIWGADTNIFDPDGRTLLHWAAWAGSIHLVKLLIERGLDVKDKFGKKAIHYAADRGHHSVVEYFISYHSDNFML